MEGDHLKTLKPLAKKTNKHDRERKVLIALIEHYIQTGKPVGSSTLKEAEFEDLSSATIRNYFAHLEDEGFLTQQHISGGRIPTDKAFRFYAAACVDESDVASSTSFQINETRSIAIMLQQAAEKLADATKTAVFLSAPRFEQDFITGIKLLPIDAERCLCVLMTDFGDIRTEILHTDQKIGNIVAKRLEAYFNARLTSQPKPSLLKQEEELAQKLYNELIIRYIAGYSQFNEEEIYRTGLSTLFSFAEYQDPAMLSSSLSLFEDSHRMRLLLKECAKFNTLKWWIGSDLAAHAPQAAATSSVIAIPYRVNTQPVGAIGLFGPIRLPYKELFQTLRSFSDEVSDILTRSLYKYKITLRQTRGDAIDHHPVKLIEASPLLLLEDRRKLETGHSVNEKSKTSKHTARRQ